MILRARCVPSLLFLLAAAAPWMPGTAPAASAAAKKEAPPPYSKRFDFTPGQDIPLDQTIAGAHFEKLRIETEAWKSGGHHISIRIQVDVPKDAEDHQVTARIELADREGKVLAADEIEKEVEEGDALALKLSAHLDDDPAAIVATVLVQLSAWRD